MKKSHLLLVLFFMSFCSKKENMILEYKDVASFQTKEVQQSSSEITLEVSGLAFHSSLAVENITAEQKNDSVNILIALVPVQKGLSGNFRYILNIPSTISSVSFGTAKRIIWQRDKGIIN